MRGLVGTFVNVGAIIVGSLIGLLLKRGIPDKINETVMMGLSLAVLLIGISGSLKANNLILVIFSIAIGGVIGELLNIENFFTGVGDYFEKKFKGHGGKVSEGFVTASLIFCVGAMAIVGSLESGLTGNNKTIFAKALIDGITSIIFTSSLGIGVMLSAIVVLVYQGSITLLASLIKNLLTPDVISNITSVGSLLIIGISLNMLKATKIRVANLLPGIFIPIIYQLIIGIIK